MKIAVAAEAVLNEILDSWFSGRPSADPVDADNIRHVGEIS